MNSGPSTVWTDAHIQLLYYVHVCVMNTWEAKLNSTEESMWTQVTTQTGLRSVWTLRDVTSVYKLTCDWSKGVPPRWLTPEYSCDRTQQTCEVMMHRREEAPINHRYRGFLWYWWQHQPLSGVHPAALAPNTQQLPAGMICGLDFRTRVVIAGDQRTHRHTKSHQPTQTPSCHTSANKTDEFNHHNMLRTQTPPSGC